MRPWVPQQQAPTPGGQEAMQATPYQQQVFLPKRPASKLSATPSASQDHGDPAGEAEGARGRSSSRGPQNRQRRSRSSTRGSWKRRQGAPSDSLMDQMANYMASRWKRDLTHFISCCWVAQIGSLDQRFYPGSRTCTSRTSQSRYHHLLLLYLGEGWKDLPRLLVSHLCLRRPVHHFGGEWMTFRPTWGQ